MLAKQLRLDEDSLDSVEFRPRLPDLLQKELAILLLLRLELEKPCLHFRPGPNFLSIDKDAYTFPAVLVIKAQCKPPQVDNFQPAVSYRAWRQQLYGVRRQFLVSQIASNNTPLGMRSRARSTMTPPAAKPGAV